MAKLNIQKVLKRTQQLLDSLDPIYDMGIRASNNSLDLFETFDGEYVFQVRNSSDKNMKNYSFTTQFKIDPEELKGNRSAINDVAGLLLLEFYIRSTIPIVDDGNKISWLRSCVHDVELDGQTHRFYISFSLREISADVLYDFLDCCRSVTNNIESLCVEGKHLIRVGFDDYKSALSCLHLKILPWTSQIEQKLSLKLKRVKKEFYQYCNKYGIKAKVVSQKPDWMSQSLYVLGSKEGIVVSSGDISLRIKEKDIAFSLFGNYLLSLYDVPFVEVLECKLKGKYALVVKNYWTLVHDSSKEKARALKTLYETSERYFEDTDAFFYLTGFDNMDELVTFIKEELSPVIELL